MKFISTQIISFVIAELSCFNTSNSSPALLNIKIVQNAHLAMFTTDSLQEILVYVQCSNLLVLDFLCKLSPKMLYRNQAYLETSWISKGTLSDLREILANEDHWKVTKIPFYFTWKARFVLKIFNFLSCNFGHVGKRRD